MDFINAIGIAGLVWWVSFWWLIKRMDSKGNWHEDEPSMNKVARDIAIVSIIPALFALIAVL